MQSYSLKTGFTILLIFFISACNEANGNKKEEGNYYQVTKIVDGDTFWASNGAEKDVKVRLIGVDAPETRRTGRKEIGYFGEEAKAYLTDLLSGKSVKLVSDVDSLDRYGRTLAYVYLQDGTFVNAELLKHGYATILTIPPNVKYADWFSKLQAEARRKKKGMWK